MFAYKLIQENWESAEKIIEKKWKQKYRCLLGAYYDANLLIGSENIWELILHFTNVGLIQEEWG